MNCILIDDDSEDQEIFAMALGQVDVAVKLTASDDATEALGVLSEPDAMIPDFIFIDVNMHKMNGLQVLAEIRRMEKLTLTKIIMFSTSADLIIRQASKTLGADDFLIKPPGMHLLVDMLNTLFQDNLRASNRT